jgi:hypothetical protein
MNASDEIKKAISAREDVSAADKERAKGEYGDVSFADEKNKKYPIDTEERIRSAWSYIGQAKNQAEYSSDEVATIKRKIVAAWKDKIDKAGPPSAQDKAIDPDLLCVKALGADRIGGYAVLWGDATRKDLTGEYFTLETEELTAIFKAIGRLPWLYHHAMDGSVKTDVVGVVDVLQPDAVGLWYEAQRSRAGRYREAIGKLVSEGALGTSSGVLPGARKVAADGRITRWPIVEISATPMPAEPRMMERPIAAVKAAFSELGLNFPAQDDTGTGDEESRKAIEREFEILQLLELEASL